MKSAASSSQDPEYYTLSPTVSILDAPGNDPYLIYRIVRGLAAGQNIEGSRYNEFGLLTFYTKEEEEKIMAELKRAGIKVKPLVSAKSEERPDTNTVSPVAGQKAKKSKSK